MSPEDQDALAGFVLGVLLTLGAVALALLTGCAWGAQGVVVYQADGVRKACEAHVRFLVVGTGDTTQTSGACAPYATTTKDTGFSDNATKIIPDVVKNVVEGVVIGVTGGAPAAAGGAAAGVIKKLAPAPAP